MLDFKVYEDCLNLAEEYAKLTSELIPLRRSMQFLDGSQTKSLASRIVAIQRRQSEIVKIMRQNQPLKSL